MKPVYKPKVSAVAAWKICSSEKSSHRFQPASAGVPARRFEELSFELEYVGGIAGAS